MKHPFEPQSPRVVEGYSLRPWYNGTNPSQVPSATRATAWQVQRKRTAWHGEHLASIHKAPSGQAYLVSSHMAKLDAFVQWDDAVNAALERARARD
jgi:hypothetical protein